MGKTRAKQSRIWQYEDMPIYTGMAPVGQVQQSAATVEVERPVCFDTGEANGKPCICGKGER